MKALLPLSLVTLFIAGPALADCPLPTHSITIPDGATATKEALLAAQHGIKDFDAGVKGYIECLKGEQDAKLAAGGDKLSDADRQKINVEYANLQNTQVDRLQKLADQFNVELRAWKAKTAPPAQP